MKCMSYDLRFTMCGRLSRGMWLALLIGACCLCAPAQAQGLKGAGVTTSSLTITNVLVASTRAATLYSATAYNASASDLYLLVFDATSLPANNTVPKLSPVKILADKTGGYDFNVAGCRFANGIVVATSTTPITLTNGTASFQIVVTSSPLP